MSQKTYKKKLYKLWDDFWLAEDETAIQLGKNLAGFLSEIDDLDAEDFYLWGLSIYSLNQEGVLEQSHPLFKRALGEDKDYYLARLYSAHCYHDKGEYKNALSEYLKVEQDLLKSEMPIWRWVKLLEQIGFCYTRLKKIELAEPYFEKVIREYISTEKGELVPIQEAYECLSSEHPLWVKLKEAENEQFS